MFTIPGSVRDIIPLMPNDEARWSFVEEKMEKVREVDTTTRRSLNVGLALLTPLRAGITFQEMELYFRKNKCYSHLLAHMPHPSPDGRSTEFDLFISTKDKVEVAKERLALGSYSASENFDKLKNTFVTIATKATQEKI